MLSQHGAVTLGHDPWGAYLRMEKLEYLASVLKHAHDLAGCEGVRRLNAEQVKELKASYGKNKNVPRESDHDEIVERVVQEVLAHLESSAHSKEPQMNTDEHR